MVENKPGKVRRPRVNKAVSEHDNAARLRALLLSYGGEMRRAGALRREMSVLKWIAQEMSGERRTSDIMWSCVKWDQARLPEDRSFEVERQGRAIVGVRLRPGVKVDRWAIDELAKQRAAVAAALPSPAVLAPAAPTPAAAVQPTQPPLTPAVAAPAPVIPVPAPAPAPAPASATATPAPASGAAAKVDAEVAELRTDFGKLWNRNAGQYQRIAGQEKITKRIEPMVDAHEARLAKLEGLVRSRVELEEWASSRVAVALAEQREVEEGLRDEVAELRATVAKQNEALEGVATRADVEGLNAALVAVVANTGGTNGNGHVPETWKDKALRLLR